jgi:phosphate starvation-inducible protein PhoH and related proteins
MARKNKRVKASKEEKRQQHYLQLISNGELTPNHLIPKPREKAVEIIPRNFNQHKLVNILKNKDTHITFAIGPAGTGKTLLSTLHAIDMLKTHQTQKLIITRPAVSVDEQHGFLPGTIVDKMLPWTKPIFDIFEAYYTPKHIKFMLDEGIIEIAPLAYMRGRTFKDSIIIADEMQNATESQMKMLLTRIGERSQLVVTGDLDQHDRGFESNGLGGFVERLAGHTECSNMINVVEFTYNEIERHPVVSEILEIYKGESQHL